MRLLCLHCTLLYPRTVLQHCLGKHPLTMLQESLTGPVARLAASITVVVCGVMMAMGEGGQFGRTAIKLVIGLSLAILGNQFITAMFGK